LLNTDNLNNKGDEEVFELISEIGSTLFLNVVQIVIGCILASLIYYFGTKKHIKTNEKLLTDLLMIGIFSIFGMIFPLNTYGLIPIFIALTYSGFRMYSLLPLLISNALFNMLVPFTDVSFVWRTGIRRVIFAFVVANMAGIILRKLENKCCRLLREDVIAKFAKKPERIIDFINILRKSIVIMGIYLIVGVIVDTIFHKYIWWDILDLLTKSQYTSFIPEFFAGYNVVNPFFLLAFTILFLLMDFIKMSALLTVFKLKGLIIFYSYFIIIAIILGTSAFL
jgi:uncharacterized membrane protein YraQ (UPF0718 family)